MLIAIDGPAGAGKSTVARALAERLGFTYLDSGAMYRCVGLLALDAPDQSPVALADSARIELAEGADPALRRVLLNGHDVSEAIRTPEVSEAASHVAADLGVRKALVAKQRELISSGDCVAEGRDIGTVVAPDAGRCGAVQDVPAYHDHNWGVWRDVTWEWGAARGARTSILYGGVYAGEGAGSPFFLALVDSLGVRQILRFRGIDYRGSRPAAGVTGTSAPRRFDLAAGRLTDTLNLHVDVADALATGMGVGGMRRAFLQMRGSFRLKGTIDGAAIAERGRGSSRPT